MRELQDYELPCDEVGFRLYKVPAGWSILLAHEITYYLSDRIPITIPSPGEPEQTWSAKIKVTGMRMLNNSKIERDPDAVKPKREPSFVVEDCTFNVPAEETTEITLETENSSPKLVAA